jgi:hypothetical protein
VVLRRRRRRERERERERERWLLRRQLSSEKALGMEEEAGRKSRQHHLSTTTRF